MGNTTQQHRIQTRSFSCRMASLKWRPGVSGKARYKTNFVPRLCSSPKFSRFLLLMKLFLSSVPLCMLTMNTQGLMVPSMVDSVAMQQVIQATYAPVQGEINQKFYCRNYGFWNFPDFFYLFFFRSVASRN